MKRKAVESFVTDNWHIFPTMLFYKTTPTISLIPTDSESIYIYSFHKIKNPRIKRIDVGSNCFRIWHLQMLGFSEPIGYVFIPKLPTNHKFRYTPLALAATNPEATPTNLENSERNVLIDDRIKLIWYSCGVEVVTDLADKMSVSV